MLKPFQGCIHYSSFSWSVPAPHENVRIIMLHFQLFSVYDADLIDDLQGDTSGYFGRMMYSLASGARQECDSDDELAEEEAQKLVDVCFCFKPLKFN